MEQIPQSSSAKASELAERLSAQEKERQEAEKSEMESSLTQKIGDEMERGDNRASEKQNVARLSSEIKFELTEKKTGRKKIQSEGKDAAKILRATPAGKKALESKDSRSAVVDEVFGETIAVLKSINEEVKTKRVELEQLLAKEKERDMAFWEETREKRDAFYAEYPNISNTFSKVKALEDWTSTTEHNLATINEYQKKQEGYLDDSIVWDSTSYNKICDATLENKLAEVEKVIDAIKSEKENIEAELNELKDKGKGFFQSKSAFEADLRELEAKIDGKKNELREQSYNSSNTGRSDLLGKREELKKIIDDVFHMSRVYGDDERKLVVEEAKTLGGLFDIARQTMKAKLSTMELKDEEKLVYELYKAFEKSSKI